MTTPFDHDGKTIKEYINNALQKKLAYSVVVNFEITELDGKIYKVEYRNFDVITPSTYRINSAYNTAFRYFGKQKFTKGKCVHRLWCRFPTRNY